MVRALSQNPPFEKINPLALAQLNPLVTKWLGVSANQRGEPKLYRVILPVEQTRVMETHAIHGGNVVCFSSRDINEKGIVKPTLGREAKRLVLFFPPSILIAFPASTDNGSFAIRRPAGKLRPRPGLVGQLRSNWLSLRSISFDYHRPVRATVRMSPTRQIRSVLVVANHQVGRIHFLRHYRTT